MINDYQDEFNIFNSIHMLNSIWQLIRCTCTPAANNLRRQLCTI